ncbi:MAG: ATP-binding protein [Candidatus Neomarinimicrobiota bacterium]
MLYKRFFLNCILRVIGIAASVTLLVFILLETALMITAVILFAVIVYQVWELVKYVTKSSRDLARFFESIRHADFSQTFLSGGRGQAFNELTEQLNEVMKAFHRERAVKEEHFHYLSLVFHHVGIALLSFNREGRIDMVNNAAARLFGLGQLTTLDDLEALSPELVTVLREIKNGEKRLVNVEFGRAPLRLALYASEIKLRDKAVTLVSLQDIRPELDEQELESWHKLVGVLTHEIMNSVTPISSLASTLSELLPSDDTGEKITAIGAGSEDVLLDVRRGIQTIEQRSRGLLDFVQSYRNLTKVPQPAFRMVRVTKLFAGVQQLLAGQMEEQGIEFQVDVEPSSLEITADSSLVEQVLINLLRNAIEAFAEQKERRITLRGNLAPRGRVELVVLDNGPGILDEVKEKIFVPFFTTKQSGSGIGLSLCREIMRRHGGNISVSSQPKEETAFTLTF